MDLVSTIRKEGSRGGVDFKWSDIENSNHREHYLGHSLMAPVGRWQKGRDLTWYAKSKDDANPNETEAERAARERREEIRRVKEAEEDAMARALGLPVAPRNTTGANSIEVGEVSRVVREVEADMNEDEDPRRGLGERTGGPAHDMVFEAGAADAQPELGGLLGHKSKPRDGRDSRRARDHDRERDNRRSRSRSREHRHRRHRDRSRSGERRHHRERRHRSHSRDRRDRRHRSRSHDRTERRERRERRERSGSRGHRKDDRANRHVRHRSRSPATRDDGRRRERH